MELGSETPPKLYVVIVHTNFGQLFGMLVNIVNISLVRS